MFHQILFVLTIAISAFSYAFLITDDTNTAAKVFGYLGSLASILMFGSPLTSIVNFYSFSHLLIIESKFIRLFFYFKKKNVMKTQSTESLSFLLCLANFACSSLWAIYGSLIHDGFVIVIFFKLNLLNSFRKIKYFTLFFAGSQSCRFYSWLHSNKPVCKISFQIASNPMQAQIRRSYNVKSFLPIAIA